MSTHDFKVRLAQLEGKAAPFCTLPAVRIIQDGELTDEQTGIVADAKVTGRLVIIRQLVDHD